MKFSCIICSYNPKPEWLENAIKSAEGLFDELIIIDDGSATPIPGATARHETNKGLYEAKNTGVRLATGDIICFLDDDDEFVRDGVVEMKSFVEEHQDYDVWSFDLDNFGEGRGRWNTGQKANELRFHNQFAGVSWFRRSIWEEVGGFTYPLAEDWEFWIKAWKKGKKFIYSPVLFYRYRVRKDSVSHGWGSDLASKMHKEMRELALKE